MKTLLKKYSSSSMLSKVKGIPYLMRIKNLAKKERAEVYIIGGVLRDIFLLGRFSKPDFDFAVSHNPLRFAKEFASLTKGKVVILDKVLRNVRVVLKRKNKVINYDFSGFRGKPFLEDLTKRDFTINTLAVKVNDYPKIKIEDHLGGLEDIRKKALRCAGKASFADDPLRIMRAFSLSALYDLKLIPETERFIVRYKNRLKETAPERVSEELFKVLSSKNTFRTFQEMDKLGVLDKLFPEIKRMKGVKQGGYHHLDVWPHSLETVRCFENSVLKTMAKGPVIADYLNEEVSQGRDRLQLIKFACLFHDIGKPKSKKVKSGRMSFYGHEKIGRDLVAGICRRMRMSSKEEDFIKNLVYLHLRPGFLADTKKLSQKAVYRFFRVAGDNAVAVIILCLSDWRATRGKLIDMAQRKRHERIMVKLIREYFEKKREKPLKRIVTGYDVMRKFKISPSPLVGKVLREIEEQRALNKVSSKRQAFEAAREIIKESYKDTVKVL